MSEKWKAEPGIYGSTIFDKDGYVADLPYGGNHRGNCLRIVECVKPKPPKPQLNECEELLLITL